MTKSQIEYAIKAISEQMKQHMPDWERATLHAEREDLRERLADEDYSPEATKV